MNKNFYKDEKEKKKITKRREGSKTMREGKNKGSTRKGEKILPKNTKR